jgi:tRNA U34 2-thiouridine synthase MnmA/TrmU
VGVLTRPLTRTSPEERSSLVEPNAIAELRGLSAQAGVELRVVPLTTEYWDRVVSHTVEEISHGRTPNPDILCNSRVKFGAFYDHLASGQEGQVQTPPSRPRAGASLGPHP